MPLSNHRETDFGASLLRELASSGPRSAPVDEGERLATIPRGPNCELRIRLKKYKGHRFIDVREYSVNAENAQWWPTRGKGISVKLRELDAVVAALHQAQNSVRAE